jgi:tetratricopeptide (TPR) repeat protein
MKKGDLVSAKRTIQMAMQEDPRLWLTYYMRARLFERERKYELAAADCNWVLHKYPKFIEAALLRAKANAHVGRDTEALQELNHIVRIRPPLDSYARALRDRACFLATCSDPSLRNGPQAVQDAKIACKLTNWTDETAIDSLAFACAEIGDFDSAVRYAHQASRIISTTQSNSPVALVPEQRSTVNGRRITPIHAGCILANASHRISLACCD